MDIQLLFVTFAIGLSLSQAAEYCNEPEDEYPLRYHVGGGKCYALNRIYSYNFAQAQEFCQSRGGHILTLETIEEWNSVKAWLREVDHPTVYPYILGATATMLERSEVNDRPSIRWQWLTGGAEFMSLPYCENAAVHVEYSKYIKSWDEPLCLQWNLDGKEKMEIWSLCDSMHIVCEYE